MYEKSTSNEFLETRLIGALAIDGAARGIFISGDDSLGGLWTEVL